jgi:hypothetical protein
MACARDRYRMAETQQRLGAPAPRTRSGKPDAPQASRRVTRLHFRSDELLAFIQYCHHGAAKGSFGRSDDRLKFDT